MSSKSLHFLRISVWNLFSEWKTKLSWKTITKHINIFFLQNQFPRLSTTYVTLFCDAICRFAMLVETDASVTWITNLILLLETSSQKNCTRMVKLRWDISSDYNFYDSIYQNRFYPLLETSNLLVNSYILDHVISSVSTFIISLNLKHTICWLSTIYGSTFFPSDDGLHITSVQMCHYTLDTLILASPMRKKKIKLNL